MTITLKCIIIDTDLSARRVLQEYIGTVAFLSLVEHTETPAQAHTFLSDKEIDIAFLDTNAPGLNGIEILKRSMVKPCVIITSTSSEHAAKAFELNAADYLLKPISFERFVKSCNRVKELCDLKRTSAKSRRKANDHFFVKCNDQLKKLPMTNCYSLKR